ncbi:MAG: PQQ-binding-like beta-propeller repeat protein [Planctomycetota bacterium]
MVSSSSYVHWTFTLLVLSVGPASAQNWPSFRGPNGSGVGVGSPPVNWNVETGENIKWKTPIPGLAHSSPIVWGDRVFVTTSVSGKPESTEVKTGWLNGTGDSATDSGPWTWKLFCLDKSSGKVLWEKDAHSGVPKIKRHMKATHANSTPATDGKYVVAFFGSEGLFCYNVTGELLWQKDLGIFKTGPHNGKDLEWGYASSPIIHKDQVIVQCDAINTSFWASFDLATGNELRRVTRNENTTTWSTPTVIDFNGKAQLVCNGWKQMAGYDLKTGEQLWNLRDGGDCPVPTPQWAHGNIYLTNGHGKSPVFAIKPDARGDITPEAEDRTPKGMSWWQSKGGSYMPTPIVIGDNLYIATDNGVISVLDAKTGKQLRKERLENAGTFSASIVGVKEQLYFVNEDGDVFVLKSDKNVEQLARNPMHEVCLATPAISDGKLLIRTRDNVYCIGK